MTLAIGALATLTVDGIKSLAIDLFGLTLTSRVIQVISLLAVFLLLVLVLANTAAVLWRRLRRAEFINRFWIQLVLGLAAFTLVGANEAGRWEINAVAGMLVILGYRIARLPSAPRVLLVREAHADVPGSF